MSLMTCLLVLSEPPDSLALLLDPSHQPVEVIGADVGVDIIDSAATLEHLINQGLGFSHVASLDLIIGLEELQLDLLIGHGEHGHLPCLLVLKQHPAASTTSRVPAIQPAPLGESRDCVESHGVQGWSLTGCLLHWMSMSWWPLCQVGRYPLELWGEASGACCPVCSLCLAAALRLGMT